MLVGDLGERKQAAARPASEDNTLHVLTSLTHTLIHTQPVNDLTNFAPSAPIR
jgi:hypothetical protein